MEEVSNELLDGNKVGTDFLSTNVFVVAFTSFVVVAHDANTINNVSHAVFEVMAATKNGWSHLPDFNPYVFGFPKMANELFIQSGWHKNSVYLCC
ncbi:hypothetical protein C9Z24_07155 [Escherichia coli]|uniref:Uncharacterized protein n=1 Tax=Escherichia coli TaxID=562 RepID=A0A2T3TH46_ECOLX|nr:hypothetical protein [Escherichia coli]EIH23755.1 hypothetical protein EC12264_3512 [Escherichia coli 1.2264]EII22792.1 hypothetical protein EC90111_3664 [Escherichia coli 9.0111]ERC58398.1 hypothetical protein ECOT7509_1710 [Escherichia coli TW07509]EFH2481328.1 hypothetical protein [Escherichia coli]